MKSPKQYRNKMFEELSAKEIQEILDFKDERTNDERFIDALLDSGEYERRDVICAKTGKTLKDVIVCKADYGVRRVKKKWSSIMNNGLKDFVNEEQ
jgi:hypothetical protein